MVFYPHYIGDFIKDTARLNDSQSMAYLRLIWDYYTTEQPLDDDAESIAFKIGANPSDVNLILRHFFFLHDGKWHQSRCDEVISDFYAKSASARASANARWEKRNANANALKKNANALRSECDGNANAPKNDATHNSLLNTQSTPLKTIRAPRFDAVASLLSSGVSEQVARDWIKHRKEKRATVTQTVIDGHISEATKAGISLETALAYACSAGWQGFKADWYESRSGGKQVNGYRGQTQAQINKEISTRAAIGGLLESIATPFAIQTTGETYDH